MDGPGARHGPFGRLSFQQRIFYSVVAVLTVCSGLVVAFAWWRAESQTEATVGWRLDRAASSVAAFRESDRAMLGRLAAALAGRDALATAELAAAGPLARAAQRELGAAAIAILDPDGASRGWAGAAPSELVAAIPGLVERAPLATTVATGSDAYDVALAPLRDDAGWLLLAYPLDAGRLADWSFASGCRIELRAGDAVVVRSSEPTGGAERATLLAAGDELRLALILDETEIAAEQRSSLVAIASACLLATILGGLLARVLALRLARPLSDALSILADVGALVTRVSDHLDAGSHQVSGALAETRTAIDTMRTTLANNAEQADSLESAVLETTGAMRQMGSSVTDISHNAQDAVRSAQEAVAVVERTNRTVTRLGESSGQIGEVSQTITQIARQINMLALNATIEAAQAGEAGRGFAVVAAEVKDLARATSAATDEIAARIRGIQGNTQEAVEAIGSIVEAFEWISATQISIANAVEDQSATTDGVSKVAGKMAQLTREVAEATQAGCREGDRVMTSMEESAKVTRDSFLLTARLEDSVGELEEQSARIRELFFGENGSRPAGTTAGGGAANQ